jgi:hypothetical protein
MTHAAEPAAETPQSATQFSPEDQAKPDDAKKLGDQVDSLFKQQKYTEVEKLCRQILETRGLIATADGDKRAVWHSRPKDSHWRILCCVAACYWPVATANPQPPLLTRTAILPKQELPTTKTSTAVF